MKDKIKNKVKEYRESKNAVIEAQKNMSALQSKLADIGRRIESCNIEISQMKIKKGKALSDCAVGKITETDLAKVCSELSALEVKAVELSEMAEAVNNAITTPDTPLSDLVNAERSAYLSIFRGIDSQLQANILQGYVAYMEQLKAAQIEATGSSGSMTLPYLGRIDLNSPIPGIEQSERLQEVKRDLESDFLK